MRLLMAGVLLAGLAAAAAKAQAATVYLKDGGELQGNVVSSTANGVKLETAQGTVRIPAEKIANIDYAQPAPAPAPVRQPAPAPRYYAPAPRGARAWRPAPDWDQLYNREHEFVINLGIGSPVSDVDFTPIPGGGFGRNGSDGFIGGGRYVYYPSPWVGFGVNVDFFNRPATDSHRLLDGADTNVSGNSAVILGILKLRMVPGGPVRPYFLAGAGVNRTSEVIDVTPFPGNVFADTGTAETRRLVDDSAWGFASTARLGIDFQLPSPVFFGFEMGWLGLFNRNYSATPAGQNLGFASATGTLHVFVTNFLIGWRF